jgi:hypothetical protein
MAEPLHRHGHYSLQIDNSGRAIHAQVGDDGLWEARLFIGRGVGNLKASHASLAESIRWATQVLRGAAGETKEV